MIRFLWRGLVRDRARSLFPTLVVLAGVALTVVMHGYLRGTESDLVRANAAFGGGHVSVMSRAYAAEADLVPNDLALLGADSLLATLGRESPAYLWSARIRFGGLVDVPDAAGETRTQAPVAGLAVDLLDPASPEHEILAPGRALVRGRLPAARGEALLSEDLAQRLDVAPGQTVTIIGTTMYGSLTTANFRVVGTLRFGVTAVDRGAMLLDLADARAALDMAGGAGVLIGFARDGQYRQAEAAALAARFNAARAGDPDPFAPVMSTLREHAGLGQTLDLAATVSGALIALFVLVMSVVLWNAGLMASLRRYGEFGLRLAIGEEKGHLYGSLLAEALMIGLLGSVLGTGLGLLIAWLLQERGLDISPLLRSASMLISDRLRARITPASWLIGFLPGLAATFLGAAISGVGIFRRQTARLSKELET
ncbi:MAG: FtsX-like permease family protein [Candidatus Krumholzibacteriota bacterium]|nr:FtsX-like permease family protein [Candidatus Krumholzibacteriota bacterium]